MIVNVMGIATPTVGSSTTLECSVTSGNPSATMFRWTRNGIEVQAASATSFYTFNPTTDDNGKTYACIATNGISSDPTTNLVLTVNSETVNDKQYIFTDLFANYQNHRSAN